MFTDLLFYKELGQAHVVVQWNHENKYHQVRNCFLVSVKGGCFGIVIIITGNPLIERLVP